MKNISDAKQSIWKLTENGEWKLFFDTEQTERYNEISVMNKDTIIFIHSNKNVKMGSLVMSPKGIGLLVKLDDNKAKVKFKNEERFYEFEECEIQSDFSIYVKHINFDYVNCFKMTVPTNGDISMVKNMLEKLGLVDNGICDCSLIFNGNEINDHMTFEGLNLKSGDKFLLTGMKKIEFKLSRFDTTNDYWYCNPDAIIFSTNRKIKLTGIGLYISMDGVTQNGTINVSLVEGETSTRRRRRTNNSENANYLENLVLEQSASIPNHSETGDNKFRVTFEKPVSIKPFHDYKIEFTCNDSYEVWCGAGGKATIRGEKNLDFYFKQFCYDSNATTGNFPDLFYYL